RAAAGPGVEGKAVAQDLGQAAHDGETQAQALGAVAVGVLELVELLEDRLALGLRDAAAGVPDLQARLRALPDPAHAHHRAAAVGVAHGVADQVAQDAL